MNLADEHFVTIQDLDFIFPFVIFVYGFIMVFVVNHPRLLTIAEERLSYDIYLQVKSRKTLGFICLVVGGLWSLQNIWLS